MTHLKNGNTFESKSKTQNSIKRVFFCLVAILLEIFLIVQLLTSLNKAAPFIEVILRILALLLVLAIYSENKTAAIKMPWVILILQTPVMGTIIFLAVGLDGGTRNMKKRIVYWRKAVCVSTNGRPASAMRK